MADSDSRLSEYRVSTITCNASVGKNVNLNYFFDKAALDDESKIVWIEYGKHTRGINPKARKVSAVKKCFDNQATIISLPCYCHVYF